MSVVVIGGTNLDLHARSVAPMVAGTSNPGVTETSPGGVGRNVAETLARLGTPVALVSVVGDDALGAEVLEHTKAVGVDCGQVLVRGRTGTYTALLGHDGELVAAVADMAAIDELTPAVVEASRDLIADAELLVLDGNLAPAAVSAALRVAASAGVRVALEPVSVPKATRLEPVLGALFLLTPNEDELAALGGADALHARGVETIWVRQGAAGSTLSTVHGDTRLPAHGVDVVDVTGAGDAGLGAFCHALLGGADPVAAARYGQAAAALTVASPHTVRPDLSDELIRSLL